MKVVGFLMLLAGWFPVAGYDYSISLRHLCEATFVTGQVSPSNWLIWLLYFSDCI